MSEIGHPKTKLHIPEGLNPKPGFAALKTSSVLNLRGS